jgi:cytolysin-activating lysine-acyltransferase
MLFEKKTREKSHFDSGDNAARPATVTAPLGDERAPEPANAPAEATANSGASIPSAAAALDSDTQESKHRTQKVAALFGEVVTLLMRTPPYKELWLSDLEWLVVPALLSGQVSVATATSRVNGATLTVGAILWARVSAEVDERLACQPGEIVRLASNEWTSGDTVWVVASAGDRRVLREMLEHLSTNEWVGKEVRIKARTKNRKPMVANLVAAPA